MKQQKNGNRSEESTIHLHQAMAWLMQNQTSLMQNHSALGPRGFFGEC